MHIFGVKVETVVKIRQKPVEKLLLPTAEFCKHVNPKMISKPIAISEWHDI